MFPPPLTVPDRMRLAPRGTQPVLLRHRLLSQPGGFEGLLQVGHPLAGAVGSPEPGAQSCSPGRTVGEACAGSLPRMASVIPLEELRHSATAALFQGRGDLPVSIFLTAYERGGEGS
jgi:hypothetical protein